VKTDFHPHDDAPRFGRVLLIGLDGATYDVLDPLMKAGKMPNLKAIIADGVHGPLESTRPPITPAAWPVLRPVYPR
jgi:predicted AlkP superfamily phosphohydrolase/phosphomutase